MSSQSKFSFCHKRFFDHASATHISCELCVGFIAATSVSLTGPMAGRSRHLMMTQTPSGLWIARLLLIPAKHSARVHITEINDPPSQRDVVRHRYWDVDFNVPNLRSNEQTTLELRIWLHKPEETKFEAKINLN